MKKLQKFKTIISIVVMMLLLLSPKQVQANVQSRSDKARLTNKTASEFFELIRKMETSSGPMGLSATVEEVTVNAGTANEGKTISETSDSNNIDAHMMKNTEWGAVAMLMDSAYGSKQSGSSSTATTTGNKSGVYEFSSRWEYIAGMWNTKNSYNGYIYYANEKYWDKYTEEANKVGDATKETLNWKNSSGSGFVSSTYPVFIRGSSSAFSFNGHGGYANSNGGARVAVVCGSRILKCAILEYIKFYG